MQTDQPPNTSSGFSTPAQFRSKLGTYLTGVIIGLVFLGVVYYQKHLSMQRLQANAQASEQSSENPPESKP